MKPSHKFAAGIIASLGLGFAVATAYANPEQMGGGMEHGAQGGMQHGAKGSMQHGGQGGMQGGMGGGAQHGAGHSLMTPEERTALQGKMRDARTPEERQQIAAASHAEMQKRAQEKGITPHEGRGPRAGTRPQAPASTEHQH